jgi:hypothetical protein
MPAANGSATVILTWPTDRKRAHDWIEKAPIGTRLTFKGPKRTTDQNAKMWAMLTDMAIQVKWHGLMLKPEDWKMIMLAGLRRERRIVPNMDGTGFVDLDAGSSSILSKDEFSDLIEIIYMFGANHGVDWSEPESAQRRQMDRRIRERSAV